MAKAKISRPVLYTAILGAAAYAVVLLTQPDTTPAKHATHTTAVATKATPSDGFLPEDHTAHFDPYPAPRHDAFLPHIVSTRALANVPTNKGPARGNWVLTGISALDGQASALVENPSTGESQFLKAGDRWNGQLVAMIGTSAVTFVNGQGQTTELTFPSPEDTDKLKHVAAPAPPSAPAGANNAAAAPAGPGAAAAPAAEAPTLPQFPSNFPPNGDFPPPPGPS